MCKFYVVLFVVTLSLKSAISANILYIAPTPSPSHHIWNRALAFELANKGHNVTHVCPDMDKLPKPPNYTHILLEANTDPIVNHPQPLTPNIIPVGGLHTRKSKEISQEFQNILNSAKDGVILFSLGTNVRSDNLEKDTIKAILHTFSELSQTVIWKFESNIDNLPQNVVVRKWLPQNDILGHPNVKLFIGHGGALSTQEAFFHGVPMVVIPFFLDQFSNAKIIEKKQLGVLVEHKLITTDYFLSKLKEVLDNPIYTKNAKRLSQTYRDRKETPLDRGIFWIEYVLRHEGADFLNTAARDLPFYKLFGLDVVAFLCLLIFMAILILYKSVQAILKLFNNSKKKIKKH